MSDIGVTALAQLIAMPVRGDAVGTLEEPDIGLRVGRADRLDQWLENWVHRARALRAEPGEPTAHSSMASRSGRAALAGWRTRRGWRTRPGHLAAVVCGRAARPAQVTRPQPQPSLAARGPVTRYLVRSPAGPRLRSRFRRRPRRSRQRHRTPMLLTSAEAFILSADVSAGARSGCSAMAELRSAKAPALAAAATARAKASSAAADRVYRLAVDLRRVDEPDAGQHARWRHRHELYEQARGREDHKYGADPLVPRTVGGEEPDQEDDKRGEVHGRVIDVERLDDQRVREHEILDERLAWQVPGTLEVPEPLRPPDSAARSHHREAARVLPKRIQGNHQPSLAQERRRSGQLAPPWQPSQPGHAEKTRGQDRRKLPRQLPVRHPPLLPAATTASGRR